jgi:hypothetical protein
MSSPPLKYRSASVATISQKVEKHVKKENYSTTI